MGQQIIAFFFTTGFLLASFIFHILPDYKHHPTNFWNYSHLSIISFFSGLCSFYIALDERIFRIYL
ncbi:hypothetical protein ACINIS235_A0107 [Acinetobacter baumannii IS-235]|nr:hypothetical protein ACINIS58_A0076 [Acinetobacter baumannii IS-58]EKK06742.1 hypothetical protein ACINIS235_A0107 [Acinetobacter baumannii IS-235]